MGLSLSLLLIFLLFCLLMAAVLAFCLRQRRRESSGRDATIDYSAGNHSLPLSLDSPPRSASDDDADQRTALTIFGSIILGGLLAIATGYLVFFREWAV